MIERMLTLVFGSKHERDIRKMLPTVQIINQLEEHYRSLSAEDFPRLTEQFRQRLADGETLEDILPEVFAASREAGWRTLGLRHFDVQMIGGMVLHSGRIAEMKTGEGKTLTSTLAIYLNALAGRGVHVVTVNDYLARRDAEWMKPLYDFLGVSVGIIQSNMDYVSRRAAYNCDITYATNNELGFDYLRDNMVTDKQFRVQRKPYYGIVDEVDSILIDEARTPLIISGPTEENTGRYKVVDQKIRELIASEAVAPEPPEIEVEPGKEEPHLIRGWFYDVDEKSRNVTLTEEGIHKMEELFEVENLYAPENVELVAHTGQSLRAHIIYKDEVDYVVRDGEVIIVDEHTGRLMEGRRYSDGLHQAIEAKEGVEVRQETQTLATITFQNFFRMYEKLAGMTGTADTEAEEFGKIYRLQCVVIPTNVLVQRIDYADRVYLNEKDKFNAILADIRDCHERGQPVLVGTISIEKSELIAQMLTKEGIPHNVLNAKQHQREAEIVANAGKPGAVTVATNMAGRGTDIVLGGASTYLAELEEIDEGDRELLIFRELLLKKQFDAAREQIDRITTRFSRERAEDAHKRATAWLAEHNKVKENGGLYIIGTERHDSRRIDNQLRGRSGRQGDPGASRFYLSLEDHLMRLFGGERIMGMMERMGMKDGQELEARMVDRAIARAQKRVEAHNFDIRKHLLQYDDVMNRQREFVYEERNHILDNEDIRERLHEWAEESLEVKIEEWCNGNDPTRWDIESLREWLHAAWGVEVQIDSEEMRRQRDPQLALFEELWRQSRNYYMAKVETIGNENYSYVERRIALDVIDARWKEHLYAMDHLREGIWATSYSGNNPLVEYKLQGFRIFDQMVHTVKEHISEFLFRVQIQRPEEIAQEREESAGKPRGLPPRELGQAQHQSLDGFAGGSSEPVPGQLNQLPAGAAERKVQTSAVTAGGASRKKGSRRRRR